MTFFVSREFQEDFKFSLESKFSSKCSLYFLKKELLCYKMLKRQRKITLDHIRISQTKTNDHDKRLANRTRLPNDNKNKFNFTSL